MPVPLGSQADEMHMGIALKKKGVEILEGSVYSFFFSGV